MLKGLTRAAPVDMIHFVTFILWVHWNQENMQISQDQAQAQVNEATSGIVQMHAD